MGKTKRTVDEIVNLGNSIISINKIKGQSIKVVKRIQTKTIKETEKFNIKGRTHTRIKKPCLTRIT